MLKLLFFSRLNDVNVPRKCINLRGAFYVNRCYDVNYIIAMFTALYYVKMMAFDVIVLVFLCDLGAHVGADALCLCIHNIQYSFFVIVLTLSISEIFEC